jgi:flagellar FliL protein
MADEQDITTEEKGGGRKKLIIIIAVAVVLLLSAGAAAYLLLGSEAEGEQQAQEPEVEEGDPVYHKLAPEFIVTLPPGGPAGVLQVSIEVMSRTPGVPEALAANDPMIRHHLLNLLETQQAAELLTVEGKEALQAAIHELLSDKLKELGEPGEIKGVFFTQFVMQ